MKKLLWIFRGITIISGMIGLVNIFWLLADGYTETRMYILIITWGIAVLGCLIVLVRLVFTLRKFLQ